VSKLTNYCCNEKNFKVPIMEAVQQVLAPLAPKEFTNRSISSEKKRSEGAPIAEESSGREGTTPRSLRDVRPSWDDHVQRTVSTWAPSSPHSRPDGETRQE
jgi:hypothetical protein